MIEGIGIFILFLCPLIFFHEMGHFICARLFGVRVEVFSLGFGPKLFKFKKWETEYAISLIPFGGYVKMFGDDPLGKDAIPVEERKFSFNFKGKWARFCIVIGGPLANFLLAYFIFVLLLLVGEKVPELRFGIVPDNSAEHRIGIRSGDVVSKINGARVLTATDLAISEDAILKTVTVSRNDTLIQFTVGTTMMEFFQNYREFSPLRKPIVVDKSGQKYLISLDKAAPSFDISLEQLAYFNSAKRLYFFPVEDSVSGLKSNKLSVKPAFDFLVSFTDESHMMRFLEKKGFWPTDLIIKKVIAGSPSDKAGLRSGDIIISLQGKKLNNFLHLRNSLQKIEGPVVSLKILRDGKSQEVKLKPEIKEDGGERLKLIGIYSAGFPDDLMATKYINTPSRGLIGSFREAFSRTGQTTYVMFSGIKKLFTGKVSIKQIGGPIAIGKVARDSFYMSLSYFFQIMALISVNLGIINLFPIPILDGGHIMFILLEIVNGGPVSQRKMEIAQQVGLSMLLLLMFLAIYNDVIRLF